MVFLRFLAHEATMTQDLFFLGGGVRSPDPHHNLITVNKVWFSLQKNLGFATVVFLALFDNYYSIID